MKISLVILALVVLSYISLSLSKEVKIKNLERVESSSWNSTISSLEKSSPQKRDVNPDAPFTFQIYYDSSHIVSSDKITFNGESVVLGYNKKSHSDVSVTATRYYSYGVHGATNAATSLAFDVDFNGRDASPQNDDITFKIFNLEYRNKGSVTALFYAWTYDQTGAPVVYRELVDQGSFNGDYQFTLINPGSYGFTRFSILLGLIDSKTQCPKSIDSHSLLEAACIAPAKNNKPRETTITAGQIFQDAGKLLSQNLKYHIRNCDGYDQKICQKPADDIVSNFVQFDEDTQTFSFGKPCQGIPTEFSCVTTVEIEILPFKDNSKECKQHVRSKVLLPVNKKGINNKYGEANCRVLPKEDYPTPYYVEEKKSCAHLDGCFKTSHFTGIVYVNNFDIGGGDDSGSIATISPPYSISQCKSICLDSGATHAAIYDSGLQCTCLDGPNYDKPVASSNCDAECIGDLALPGEKCGTEQYALVFNLDRCNKKIVPGDNFAGTPVTAPVKNECPDDSQGGHYLEGGESCTNGCDCESRLCDNGKCSFRCKSPGVLLSGSAVCYCEGVPGSDCGTTCYDGYC